MKNVFYPINNIYPCIQGEGCQTGLPMVMLRLQGCDVGCSFCDTKETWEKNPELERSSIQDVLGTNSYYTEKIQTEILVYIKQNHPNIKWVLVSGGEPAHYYLEPLVNVLHDGGLKVAIETSGTKQEILETAFDWVCVSPKKGVLPETLSVADEIKYVVGKQDDVDQLDKLLSKSTLKQGCQICLQPISQSRRATELCIQTVQARNWRLSIQIHKYLNIP